MGWSTYRDCRRAPTLNETQSHASLAHSAPRQDRQLIESGAHYFENVTTIGVREPLLSPDHTTLSPDHTTLSAGYTLLSAGDTTLSPDNTTLCMDHIIFES